MSYTNPSYIAGAEFTVQLGCLVENGFDLQLTDYPIFDETYRPILNAKIESRYWFREIGQETPAMFRFMLKRKMNEIMPFYNELYKTTLHEMNPFVNYDVTTTGSNEAKRSDTRANVHNENVSSTSAADSNATSSGRTVVSQTPQMQLSGQDDYATNLTDSTSESDTTSNASESTNRQLREDDTLNSNDTASYVSHVAGLNGILQADAIMQFRQSIINIDVMVIEELAPLFMGLYSNYSNVL